MHPKQFLIDADDLSGEGIDQAYLVIKDRDKMKYLMDFIKPLKGQIIVFCSTKYRTRDVAKYLHQEKGVLMRRTFFALYGLLEVLWERSLEVLMKS